MKFRDPAQRSITHNLYRTFAAPVLGLILAHAVGTIGYRLIGGPQYSLLDCFYMTFITIATIGYTETVDVSQSPVGRIFTVFIATIGIGLVYYMLAKMTMFLVAGEINVELRRRKMLKKIGALDQHYIVCGIGRVGSNVAHELSITDRPYVVIDTDLANIEKHRERYPDTMWIQGDASEDELLKLAGIDNAAGVFAVTGEDSKNLVISLSAKQLNPRPRVVARCHEVNYIEKIRKVGADAIVSPDFTGGMRIVSSMVRPQVVNFLDEMLRSDNKLRVEEVHVPAAAPERTLSALGLGHREFIMLAVRSGGNWHFNPEGSYAVRGGDTLITMATPHGRKLLEKVFAA
jgi:voltage-gated potassium channel